MMLGASDANPHTSPPPPPPPSFLVTEVRLRYDNATLLPFESFSEEDEDCEYQGELLKDENVELECSLADKELLEQMATLGLPTSFGTGSKATKLTKVKKASNATKRKDSRLRSKEVNASDATDQLHVEAAGKIGTTEHVEVESRIKDSEPRISDPQEQEFTKSNLVVDSCHAGNVPCALWRPVWDDYYQRYYFCNAKTLETSWEPPKGLELYAMYPTEGKPEDEAKMEPFPSYSGESAGCTDYLDARESQLEIGESQMLDFLSGIAANDEGEADARECEEECKNFLDPQTSLEVKNTVTTVNDSLVSFDVSSNLCCFESLAKQKVQIDSHSDENSNATSFEVRARNPVLESIKPPKFDLKDSDIAILTVGDEKTVNSKEDRLRIPLDDVAAHVNSSGAISSVPAWCGSHIWFEDPDDNMQEAEICGTDSGIVQKSETSMLSDMHYSSFVEGANETGSLKRKTRRRKKQHLHVLKTASEKVLLSGMLEALSENLLKYWFQRYRLFSKFDDGIKMDEEAWFSVTPEIIAKHHAERCATNVIIDAFTGVGGNAIQFALRSNHVIAIDIDAKKIEFARHNAEIYGVANKIEFVVADFFELAPSLKADVLFLSPPWGGPTYLNVEIYDLQTMLQPKDGFTLFKVAQGIASNVIFFLPRNVDRNQLAELSWLSNPPLACEVENNYVDDRLKAITAYYGPIALKQNSSCL